MHRYLTSAGPLAAVPLIINMLVAIVSTKIPILLGHGFWGFGLKSLPSYGFFSMAHEARTDLAMLLGSLFLLIVGSGPWALDRRLRIGIAAGVTGPSVILAAVVAALVATFNRLSSAQLAASHLVSGGTYEYGYRYLNVCTRLVYSVC